MSGERSHFQKHISIIALLGTISRVPRLFLQSIYISKKILNTIPPFHPVIMMRALGKRSRSGLVSIYPLSALWTLIEGDTLLLRHPTPIQSTTIMTRKTPAIESWDGRSGLLFNSYLENWPCIHNPFSG